MVDTHQEELVELDEASLAPEAQRNDGRASS